MLTVADLKPTMNMMLHFENRFALKRVLSEGNERRLQPGADTVPARHKALSPVGIL